MDSSCLWLLMHLFWSLFNNFGTVLSPPACYVCVQHKRTIRLSLSEVSSGVKFDKSIYVVLTRVDIEAVISFHPSINPCHFFNIHLSIQLHYCTPCYLFTDVCQCDKVTKVQDAVTKHYSCVVDIKINVVFRYGCGLTYQNWVHM